MVSVGKTSDVFSDGTGSLQQEPTFPGPKYISGKTPHCDTCGHQMIRDSRSRVNDRPAVWYCPVPERHKTEKEDTKAK